VEAGHFAYVSKTGSFVRVVPCHGKDKIREIARDRLIQRTRKPLIRLVLNVDADTTASGVQTAAGLRIQDVEYFLRNNVDKTATRTGDQIEIDGGSTAVSLMRWEVSDPPAPGLPDQQTLERLVSAAMAAAYAGRAKAVQDWLNARPAPPPVDPKEHAWSYMAGWYSEYGCDAFYSHLWNDPIVVAQLEPRLRASGAWQIAETLAS
jgi:hypothetical protein